MLDGYITDNFHKGLLPSTSQAVQFLIDLWGAPLADVAATANNAVNQDANPNASPMTPNQLTFSSGSQYKLPIEVSKYMGFGSNFTDPTKFSELITLYDGVLTSSDYYGGDNQDALGIFDPASIYGQHTFWQLLTDNCNTVMNELVTDLRWEDDVPVCALYKRTKPFLNRTQFNGSSLPLVTQNSSMFSDIRRIQIPLEDVININAGTNWRDKVNFVEIRPQWQNVQLNLDAQVKIDSQTFDPKAYEREGFKPMITPLYQMPFGSDGTPQLLEVTQWKYLLREWFFNTHLMLNGSMTIIGQNTYIQVGDNVQIDASILGPTVFNSVQVPGKSYLTAHVENISHQFTVTPETGARSFITTIQFVRGVFTDQNGLILGSNNSVSGDFSTIASYGLPPPLPAFGASVLDSALDSNVSKLTPDMSTGNNVQVTPTSTDPKKGK
jgi:hypothetical protein